MGELGQPCSDAFRTGMQVIAEKHVRAACDPERFDKRGPTGVVQDSFYPLMVRTIWILVGFVIVEQLRDTPTKLTPSKENK